MENESTREKPLHIVKRRRSLKKDLDLLKEGEDLANFRTRKFFKTRERFNASIMRSMVTLLDIAGLKRERKIRVQKNLSC